MRGTVKVDLRYLYKQNDRYGKVRWYVRYKGKKVRVPEPESEGFGSAYEAAKTKVMGTNSTVAGLTPGKAGSLKWLCEKYFLSAEFRNLAERTQYVRRGILDRICTAKGHLPFARMERRHIRELRDAKDGPEAGNAIVKALRQVCKWAIDVGHMDRNPAADVPYIKTGSQGFHTWTQTEVERFKERYPLGTKEYLALCLLLFTGARRSDVVRLGKGMERNGEITYRQQKTGVEVTLPIRPELRQAIDACPSGHMTYLVTQFGKPFSPDGFGNWFRGRCIKAGCPGRAHGLRKAGATIAAENGASSHELMAVYGWASIKQAEVYTRKADRKRLAKSGMKRLNLDQIENEIDPQTKGSVTHNR